MEDNWNTIIQAEFERTEWPLKNGRLVKLAFHRGLSGELGKPPYAASMETNLW
jgi:hypothetical protein